MGRDRSAGRARKRGPKPGRAGVKTAAIGLRTTPTMKAMAERLAKAERRSLNAWFEGLMLHAFADAGLACRDGGER